MGQEGRTPEKSILTVGDEMWIFFSSQKKKSGRDCPLRKQLEKLKH